MMNFEYIKGLFDDPDPTETDPTETDPTENMVKSTDIEPAISYDHIDGITTGFKRLMEVLGINRIRKIANGAKIALYKTTVGTVADQVAEGEDIPLTKVERKKVKEITVSLKKYRKSVTAEAIQADGYEHAVNDTDDALVQKVRGVVKAGFFTNLALGSGTATAGATLQAAMANAMAALQTKYEDSDITPIFIVNTSDVYAYLGTAAISTQNAFGFSYLKDFLGLGDVIVTSAVESGTVYATAKENLNAAMPDGGSDVARALGMSADASGTVLMKHSQNGTNASLETLLMTGVVFYAEDLSGVIKATISA
jgi:hypothetical protein